MAYKTKHWRYKPIAKNIFYSGWSGFRNNMTFGDKKKAEDFVKKIKKSGIYTQVKIKKVDVTV